jgi:hypothetical protein
MKNLPCKYRFCGNRRAHHERPDEDRGTQYVEVPDEVTDKDPVFCSCTCAMMDGWMTAYYETPEQVEARRKAWRARQ